MSLKHCKLRDDYRKTGDGDVFINISTRPTPFARIAFSDSYVLWLENKLQEANTTIWILWVFIFVFAAISALFITHAGAYDVPLIIEDYPNGWSSTGDYKIYDLEEALDSGYCQFIVDGWTSPAQGQAKSHIISAWEKEGDYNHHDQTGSFFCIRIGEGYHPFKFLAAPQGIGTRQEERVGTDQLINDGLDHCYRVEWQGGRITFLFDGTPLHSYNFNRMNLEYILIGKDTLYGITDPAPVFHRAELGRIVNITPPTPVWTATPTPEPTAIPTATPTEEPTATPTPFECEPCPECPPCPNQSPCGTLPTTVILLAASLGGIALGREKR